MFSRCSFPLGCVYFANLFPQKRQSLIVLQFWEYFLWVLAHKVNSLPKSFKRDLKKFSIYLLR